ncbi:hypothetical protein GOD82_04190 [Sinorhizobium medicae]|nr:hypothetical protein [Sinorhizobium medicae]
MDCLLVTDNATGDARVMSLANAAFQTLTDAEDIVRAIAISGICISIDFTIVDMEAADEIGVFAA